MKIPLVDLSLSKTEKNAIQKAINKVVSVNDFILGNELTKFEKEFATYIGTTYCMGVATGTDALVLSLKALGIGKGDEVILPAMTFMATASSVLLAGATPIFVDIQATLPLIDPDEIERKITKRTRAIIPVHLYGYPCDMAAIKVLAKKHDLYIVEDACQSHGTLYKKRKTGGLGDIAAFSFYPSKNLGGFGDGGAITTSNKKIAEKIRTLRNWGAKEKYVHDIVGHNSRLDTIQAAILRIKLANLDKMNDKRRKHAALYIKLLKDLPIRLPIFSESIQGNYHVFAILTDRRDKLLNYLKKRDIYCGVHYPIPLHLQPALEVLNYKKGDFPNAELFAERTLSLPMYPQLTSKQIFTICEAIKNFFKK